MGQFDITLNVPGNSGLGLGSKDQVSRGLNLVLELKHPLLMPALLAELALLGDQTRKALKELHFVHFARFLPLRDHTALLVITEFDGPLDPYVLDFVIAIGHIFDAILAHVKDADGVWPVRKHPQEFMEFVRRNNRVMLAPGLAYEGDYPVYSAYPEQTVLDILGPRSDLPPPVREVPDEAVAFDDVQGNILKGYNAEFGCHLALRFEQPRAGRALLAALVDGDPGQLPQVTRASPWGAKPASMLNVGVTAAGLRALGVPAAVRALLPRAYLEGPADRDRSFRNGDRGPSAPRQWELGGPGQEVHLLVSVYANTKAALETASAQLRNWCADHGVSIPAAHDVAALPGRKVHFGYRDGIAQPRFPGIANDSGDDMQPRARIGEFLLGDYADLYGDDAPSIRTLPVALCRNATFAAVRVLEQDVRAFDRLLRQGAEKTGNDEEWVAAKLVGRWRNGVPLPMDPAAAVTGAAPRDVSERDWNNFDYAPSHEHPAVANDHHGMVCPVGAHTRRMNPRSAMVAGYPHSHRLVRRGMPYGPEWDGATDAPRGLYGMFFCADLERQFEFLLREWALGDSAASGIRGTRDALIGSGGEPTVFRLPMEGRDPVELEVEPLITTRGALYLLVPGISGLRYLARGEGFDEVVVRPPAGTGADSGTVVLEDGRSLPFSPTTFNPKDPEFLANPYPFYAAFRRDAPVALVKHNKYASYWVFSHQLVTEVCDRTDVFLKEPPDHTQPRGLFYMDPPRHTQVRGAMDPLFAQAATPVPEFTVKEATAALADIGGAGPFDLIPRYSNRVTRNVFMRMFGLPEIEWEVIGGGIDTVLRHFDQMLPDLERAPAAVASAALLAGFGATRALCLLKPGTRELFCSMDRHTDMSDAELLQTALHFALGGYLSTDFLVGTAVHNLLRDPARMNAFRAMTDRRNAMNELMRFDAPFQMADRFAAQRTLLGGLEIPAGARVTVVYGSANHDEAVFGADADRIRLDRMIPEGKNYVFGHGIHHCIGAQMAWIVAPTAIDLLLKARPNLAPVPARAPERYQDPYFRGFSSLMLQ